jgi:hypothetical protein
MTASTDNSEWSGWSNISPAASSSLTSSSSASSTFATANTAEEFESVISIDESSSSEHKSIELPDDKRTLSAQVLNFIVLFVPPIVHWLPRYNLRKLELDVIASISVVSALVPQAIAFAQLARLSVRFAFHSAGVAPIVYALLGTSHVNSIGPIALLAILSADAVGRLPLDPFTQTAEFEKASIALACLTGVILLAFGVLRLGVDGALHRAAGDGRLPDRAWRHDHGADSCSTCLACRLRPAQPTVFHTFYAVCAVLGTTNVGALRERRSVRSRSLIIAWRMKVLLRHHKWLRLFPEQLVLLVLSHDDLVGGRPGSARYNTNVVIGPLPQTFPKPTVPDVDAHGPAVGGCTCCSGWSALRRRSACPAVLRRGHACFA